MKKLLLVIVALMIGCAERAEHQDNVELRTRGFYSTELDYAIRETVAAYYGGRWKPGGKLLKCHHEGEQSTCALIEEEPAEKGLYVNVLECTNVVCKRIMTYDLKEGRAYDFRSIAGGI